MIGHASSKNTRAKCPTYGLTEIGTTLMVGGTFASVKDASLGVWENAPPPPQKILKSESLKTFLKNTVSTQTDNYVKKVPNINRYFLPGILKQNLQGF